MREMNMTDKEIQQIQESPDKEKAKLKERLSRIKHTIMVMSGKGGVGKSTVAANLATSLSLEGYAVGVLDGDIHGPDIPKILGVENRPLVGDDGGNIRPVEAAAKLKVISVGNLLENKDQPVIWRGPMKHSMMRHFLRDVNWGVLDFLIVDLPPGTGDEPLSIAQIIKQAHTNTPPYAIVVTTPQDVALLDSRKSVEFSRALNLRLLGIIENMSSMSCPHCGKPIDLFKTGGGERAAKDLKVPFLGAIPIDPVIVQDTDNGIPFVLADRDNEVNRAFKKIVTKVLDAIKS
jgi:ATP-binding protein involved in chromosome partitioning